MYKAQESKAGQEARQEYIFHKHVEVAPEFTVIDVRVTISKTQVMNKISLPNEITPLPTNMHSLPTFSIFAQTPPFFAQTPPYFAQPSTFARPPAAPWISGS